MSARPLPPADLGALAGCAADLARAFVSLSSDIALVIDAHGVVTTVVQNARTPAVPAAENWVGSPWAQTVTGDTRRKIEMLLADVGSSGIGQRREVNHHTGAGADIPVAYTALRLGKDGPVLAVGRDLRTVAAIQQRFLETQQDLERTYWKARQSETRYRLLYQVATDAVMALDATTLQVQAANPAAQVMLRTDGDPVTGRAALQMFDARSRPAVGELLAKAGVSGRPAEIQARLAGTHASVGVAAMPLRTESGMQVLMRLRANEPTGSEGGSPGAPLARLVDGTQEGIVITDSSGRVLMANQAFLALVRVDTEEQLRGQPLAGWLVGADGQPLAQVHGVVPQHRARLRVPGTGAGPLAAELNLDVEVAAIVLTEGDQECIGFTLRACAPADPASPTPAWAAELTALVDNLATGLGSAPLPELLRRVEQQVRSHLLQVALERAAGSAAAAAVMLGITVEQLNEMLRRRTPGAPAKPR